MQTTLLGSALSGIKIPGTTPATPPETPAAPQSSALAIPAAFTQLNTLPDLTDLPTGSSIYGYYPDPKSKSYTKCIQAGAQEGQAVICVEGNILPAHPLRFFLAMGFACRSASDNGGNITAVSLDLRNAPPTIKDEHYCTLIVVILNNQLIPCKFEFKTTKSRAAADAIRGVYQASDPNEWGKLSAAHRETVAFPIPWGRVVTEVTTSRKVSKTGLPYYQAEPSVRPSTVAEMKMLQDAAGNKQFLDTFSKIQGEYENRVSFLRGKAVA